MRKLEQGINIENAANMYFSTHTKKKMYNTVDMMIDNKIRPLTRTMYGKQKDVNVKLQHLHCGAEM